MVLNIITKAISFIDDKYKNSKERKEKYHVNVSRDSRTLDTIWGTITIERTYYETKDRKEHYYFIDKLLGLDKYSRYDPIYKSITYNLALKTNQKLGGEIASNSTSTIKEKLENNANHIVNRQTINSWLNKWQLPNLEYQPIEFDGDTLFIMADEKYIHEQIKKMIEEEKTGNKNTSKVHNHIMSKCFVCFTDITQNGKRRKLNNRMIFNTASSNAWDEFINWVTKIYDFEKLNHIVFLSDAGKWLLSGVDNLKMYPQNCISICLCEFHARQKVNRITTDQEYRNELNKYINENLKKEFKDKMTDIKNQCDKEERVKKLDDYENYILNNWKNIQNTLNGKVRSSMESHISHCIASYFSSRPKAFSRTLIQKLLKLIEYKLNGIDIQKLYLKSYRNTKTITLKKEELTFSIFDSSSTNVPIIENANNNSLFKALFGIAHA